MASVKTEPGIIYLSRIPPYMKPLKVRHIFSKYGKVGRVFLQPEGEYGHPTSTTVQKENKNLINVCMVVGRHEQL